jgi:cell pole-organizing protein PopZ
MEEILASIRRIIADDEAKPTAAEKPSSPAPAKPEKPAATAPAAKPVMNDIPPSAIPVAQATAAKVTAPPPQARAASRHAICRAAPCVQ